MLASWYGRDRNRPEGRRRRVRMEADETVHAEPREGGRNVDFPCDLGQPQALSWRLCDPQQAGPARPGSARQPPCAPPLGRKRAARRSLRERHPDFTICPRGRSSVTGFAAAVPPAIVTALISHSICACPMPSIHFLRKERTFGRGGPTTTHRIRLLWWKKRGRRLAVLPIRLGRLQMPATRSAQTSATGNALKKLAASGQSCWLDDLSW